MKAKRAAVTINLPRAEVERRWHEFEHRADYATVTFADAPGDRGTEIHVELAADGGRFGEVVGKLTGDEPVANAKDDLRRFKQLLETGEIPRSDAAPHGELLTSKVKERPARPLEDRELAEVGVR